MIECQEESCDKKFDSERGASVHHTRKHKKVNEIKCHYDCCGKIKEKYPSEISTHYDKEIDNNTTEINLPCCRECQKKGGMYSSNWQGGKVKVKCENCGNETEMWPYREKKVKGCFCEKCKADWYSDKLSGENHPRFNENTTDENSYYGEDWRKMRRKTRERDGNVCQNCGKNEEEIGRKPSVHHIIPIRSFENNNDANFLNNLVQLCPSCHHHFEQKKSVFQQSKEFGKEYLVISDEKK